MSGNNQKSATNEKGPVKAHRVMKCERLIRRKAFIALRLLLLYGSLRALFIKSLMFSML